MKILVASVHHTGTKTIFNDLLRDFGEINQQNYDCPFDGKIRIHIDQPFMEDIHYWLKKGIKAIVPLRHPRTVAIGWKSRFKPFWDLEAQWDLLKNEIDQYDPLYIPIDREDRGDWLDKVNLELKLRLSTDWPVIGQHGGEYLPLNEDDERLVETWMNDGFFKRFGYEQ